MKDIEKLDHVLDMLYRAWTDKGPAAYYHDHVKRGLKKSWPTLYIAMEQFVREWEQ